MILYLVPSVDIRLVVELPERVHSRIDETARITILRYLLDKCIKIGLSNKFFKKCEK